MSFVPSGKRSSKGLDWKGEAKRTLRTMFKQAGGDAIKKNRSRHSDWAQYKEVNPNPITMTKLYKEHPDYADFAEFDSKVRTLFAQERKFCVELKKTNPTKANQRKLDAQRLQKTYDDLIGPIRQQLLTAAVFVKKERSAVPKPKASIASASVTVVDLTSDNEDDATATTPSTKKFLQSTPRATPSKAKAKRMPMVATPYPGTAKTKSKMSVSVPISESKTTKASVIGSVATAPMGARKTSVHDACKAQAKGAKSQAKQTTVSATVSSKAPASKKPIEFGSVKFDGDGSGDAFNWEWNAAAAATTTTTAVGSGVDASAEQNSWTWDWSSSKTAAAATKPKTAKISTVGTTKKDVVGRRESKSLLDSWEFGAFDDDTNVTWAFEKDKAVPNAFGTETQSQTTTKTSTTVTSKSAVASTDPLKTARQMALASMKAKTVPKVVESHVSDSKTTSKASAKESQSESKMPTRTEAQKSAATTVETLTGSASVSASSSASSTDSDTKLSWGWGAPKPEPKPKPKPKAAVDTSAKSTKADTGKTNVKAKAKAASVWEWSPTAASFKAVSGGGLHVDTSKVSSLKKKKSALERTPTAESLARANEKAATEKKLRDRSVLSALRKKAAESMDATKVAAKKTEKTPAKMEKHREADVTSSVKKRTTMTTTTTTASLYESGTKHELSQFTPSTEEFLMTSPPPTHKRSTVMDYSLASFSSEPRLSHRKRKLSFNRSEERSRKLVRGSTRALLTDLSPLKPKRVNFYSVSYWEEDGDSNHQVRRVVTAASMDDAIQQVSESIGESELRLISVTRKIAS